MRLIDAEKKLKELKNMKVEGEVFTTAVNFAIKVIEDAPSIETKQIKYFDEEEKVWKIGDVIVEHAEQSQTGMPEYASWKDAFDAMDCQSR